MHCVGVTCRSMSFSPSLFNLPCIWSSFWKSGPFGANKRHVVVKWSSSSCFLMWHVLRCLLLIVKASLQLQYIKMQHLLNQVFAVQRLVTDAKIVLSVNGNVCTSMWNSRKKVKEQHVLTAVEHSLYEFIQGTRQQKKQKKNLTQRQHSSMKNKTEAIRCVDQELWHSGTFPKISEQSKAK